MPLEAYSDPIPVKGALGTHAVGAGESNGGVFSETQKQDVIAWLTATMVSIEGEACTM